MTLAQPLSRAAGVLLHPTSLPGRFGVGDLGPEARRFVDWMASAGASVWQVLPLVPTGGGASPYSSWAAFAGNPDLVDLEDLAEARLLERRELEGAPGEGRHVRWERARAFKEPLLERAAERLLADRAHPWQAELAAFTERARWLSDTVLFGVLRRVHAGPWWEWPVPLRDRQPPALAEARRAHAAALARATAVQFFFDRQWRALRGYAAARGVRVLGDAPIYVDTDSVEVWARRELFELSPDGRPRRIAGVPPDAFSATGQRWGNPLYDWQGASGACFAFWAERLARAQELCDWVRIDHFRGFSAYWAIPAEAPDARSGQWVPGPGLRLFEELAERLGPLPVIAEDLGVIDEPVRRLLADTGLAGMRVLQFAFGSGGGNAYLPHNHLSHAVVYTGTHDNDTTLGWWRAEREEVRHHVRVYFGVDGHDAVWTLIRAAMASVAAWAIVPVQDLLALPSEARMNTPAIADGNWGFRLLPGEITAEVAQRLRGLVDLYGRR